MTELDIYYMRDNHTFKKLTNDVNTALVEIEHEFNQGFTHGMLCSKAEGFPNIPANGSQTRLKFFASCEAVLKKWLVKDEPEPVAWMDDNGFSQPLKEPPYYIPLYTAPPKREWVGLTDDDYMYKDHRVEFYLGAMWAESKLKEKNT